MECNYFSWQMLCGVVGAGWFTGSKLRAALPE